MKVTILTVTKPLVVTVSGISAVGNESIDSELNNAWAYQGKLYIRAKQDDILYIYTTMGNLYQKLDVRAGLTTIDIADGIYFISFASGYRGKVFVQQ